MKEPKRMEIPHKVWMGPGVLEDVAELCSSMALWEKLLVISGERTYEVAGGRVERSLTDNGFEVKSTIIKHANMKTVEKVQESIESIDLLLGVGGGTCIDVAKLTSFREKVPFIGIPTAASHDGISSAQASIGRGASIRAQSPFAILADTLIIKDAPSKLTAAGCGDVIANYTATYDWELARRVKGEPYSEYAASLSRMSAKLVVKNAEIIAQRREDSARRLVKALISSGVAMSIAGSSRPASGSEHLFSHALDQIAPKPALHGEQCGVGTIMSTYLQGGNWQKIRDALKTLGCPTDAKGLDIAPKYIIKALTHAHKIRPDRYTILGDGLDESEAERLAMETGVI